MSENPKIVIEEGTMELKDIREDAIEHVLEDFRVMCSKDLLLEDVIDTVSAVRYLENAKFKNEEPRILTYEEVCDKRALLCWCEEICYDHIWKEEGDRDTISDWLMPCFIVFNDTFSEPGWGDIGKLSEYNKVRIEASGDISGKRFWTGGKKPTHEQMKAEKWEGLEDYDYE